jgi:acyl carrier protein
MDWQKVAQSASGAETSQRLSSLISASSIEPQGGEEGGRIRETLLQATPEEREAIVQAYMRDQVARVLGTSAAKLDADRPLNELGLDSLMSVELKNRVEGNVALSLPMSELMQSPTINSLSTAVLGQLDKPTLTPSEPPLARQETVAELSATVDRLSDEEVDSLLREMVGQKASESTQADKEVRGA